MLAILDFVPDHCPHCGQETGLNEPDNDGRYWRDIDYRVGASHQCDCGLMYQMANRDDILEAAGKFEGGDLKEYA